MTKRTPNGRTSRRITPAAIEAWKAGDRQAVYFALQLRPWHPHVFDVDVDAPLPPDDGTAWSQDYGQIVELRKEMIRLGGETPAINKRRSRND
jgi:hypothetical protein